MCRYLYDFVKFWDKKINRQQRSFIKVNGVQLLLFLSFQDTRIANTAFEVLAVVTFHTNDTPTTITESYWAFYLFLIQPKTCRRLRSITRDLISAFWRVTNPLPRLYCSLTFFSWRILRYSPIWFFLFISYFDCVPVDKRRRKV